MIDGLLRQGLHRLARRLSKKKKVSQVLHNVQSAAAQLGGEHAINAAGTLLDCLSVCKMYSLCVLCYMIIGCRAGAFNASY